MDNFTQMTIGFINKMDMNIHTPKFDEVEIVDDRKLVSLKGSIKLFSKKIDLDEHFLIQSIIFFSLIDNYIDLQNPDTSGESFRKKYNEFMPVDIEGQVIKELYKILKIIRNSVVHTRNMSSEGNGININYTFNSTNYKLKCSKYGLELIYSCILTVFNTVFPTKFHKENSLLSMFNDICNEVDTLESDLGTLDKSIIPSNYDYEWKMRKYIINPPYEIDGDKLHIDYFENGHNSCDYCLKYFDREFAIPEEVIDGDRKICINELYKYETK